MKKIFPLAALILAAVAMASIATRNFEGLAVATFSLPFLFLLALFTKEAFTTPKK